MKKFILVMIFVLLTALFIAFNYLLWDRENKVMELKNLETANAGYTTTINAYKREISSMEVEIDHLEDQIVQLESEKDKISEEKTTIQGEWSEVKDSLQERIDFINTIKQHLDMSVLSEPLVKWVEALNQGDFKEAYLLEYEGVDVDDRVVKLEEYVEQMTGFISNIEITQVKVDKIRGFGYGDIYLNVALDVKLTEEHDQKSFRFTEGENEIFVKVDYSQQMKGFVISAIGSM